VREGWRETKISVRIKEKEEEANKRGAAVIWFKDMYFLFCFGTHAGLDVHPRLSVCLFLQSYFFICILLFVCPPASSLTPSLSLPMSNLA
jgi:hypothetical protein